MLRAEGGPGRREGLGGGEKGEMMTKEEGAEKEGLGKGWEGRGRELREMKNGYKGGGLRGFLRQRKTERVWGQRKAQEGEEKKGAEAVWTHEGLRGVWGQRRAERERRDRAEEGGRNG